MVILGWETITMSKLFLILGLIICFQVPAEEMHVTDILLFPGAKAAMLPTVFDISDKYIQSTEDSVGYCLGLRTEHLGCFTVRGRYLGNKGVSAYFNGNMHHVYAYDKVPVNLRPVVQNAFLREWAVDPTTGWLETQSQ